MRTDNSRYIGAVHALDQEAFVTLGKTKTKRVVFKIAKIKRVSMPYIIPIATIMNHSTTTGSTCAISSTSLGCSDFSTGVGFAACDLKLLARNSGRRRSDDIVVCE